IDRMQAAIETAELVVNATPADLPPVSWLRPEQRVFDLRNRQSVEGRAMLLHQGAASFEIWTGRPAPLAVMRATLERAAEAVTAGRLAFSPPAEPTESGRGAVSPAVRARHPGGAGGCGTVTAAS